MNSAIRDEARKIHNVLLIEDDAASVELASRAAVESCPEINLSVLSLGEAVLDWLGTARPKKARMPHIILLDLKLPKLDGLAVLRTLRTHASTRDIPIVVFSAEYTQADVLMSYQVGANSFVDKPASVEQFAAFLGEQLSYWLQPRQRELVF